MKKQLAVLLVGLVLQAMMVGPAGADAYDNFPLENRAADALKPVVAATGSRSAPKTCYLFNLPTYDR